MYSDKTTDSIKPSQWVNIVYFILGILAVFYMDPPLSLIFIFAAIYKFLDILFWRFDIGEQTIMERRGILSVTRREVHYYRIKSIMIREPLHLRIFGLANVIVKTSDKYTSDFLFYAVPGGIRLRERLRSVIESRRKEQGVREHDLFMM